MIRRIASLLIVVVTGPAHAQKPAPTLTVSAARPALQVYDTLSGFTATPRLLNGKIAATSPVTWTVTQPDGGTCCGIPIAGGGLIATPPLAVALIPLDSLRHTVSLAALFVPSGGYVTLTATWRTYPGTAHIVNGAPVLDLVTLHASIPVYIGPPLVASYASFNTVAAGAPSVDPLITSSCWYMMTRDRHGNLLTGRPIAWSTSPADTMWLAAERAVCPDTSVDPAKIKP